MKPETRVAAVAALLRATTDVQTAASEVAKHVRQAEALPAIHPDKCLGALDGVDNTAVVDTVERQRVAAGLATWTTTLRQTVKAAEAAWLEHGEVFYGECALRREVPHSPAETLDTLLNAPGVGRDGLTPTEQRPLPGVEAAEVIEKALETITAEVELLTTVRDSMVSKPYPSPFRMFADRQTEPAQWVRSELSLAIGFGQVLAQKIDELRPACDELWRRLDAGEVTDRDEWERERKARATLVRDEVYPQLFAFCDCLKRVAGELPRIAPLVDSPAAPPAERFTARAETTITHALGALDAGSIVRLEGQRHIAGCPTGNLRNYSGLGAALERLAALMPTLDGAVSAERMSPANSPTVALADGGRAAARPEAVTSPPARTEVVLWVGAAHTDRNIRLARTRSAYLENHGKVADALKALKAEGHGIGQTTLYDHLIVLDQKCPGWRDHILNSGSSEIPESGVRTRTRRNSRANSR